MRVFKTELESLGHTITSRWVDFDIAEDERAKVHDARVAGSEDAHVTAEPWAQRGLEDVLKANCVIWFAPSGRRGGSHVEFGMGLALFLRTIVVGKVENVFHSLPQVERYDTFEDLVAKLLTEPENGWVPPSTVMRSSLDLL
jgi:hypothetical protein